jgi:hypothetical protein
MKSLLSAKPLFAAALAVGAFRAASAAHARTDVVLSIGVPAPYGYVQPRPCTCSRSRCMCSPAGLRAAATGVLRFLPHVPSPGCLG